MADRSTTTPPTVLSAEAIARLTPQPLGTMEGVTHRVMWQGDDSMAGVLTVPAGCRLGSHTHRIHQHHMWIIEGKATILGNVLGPGSYIHIPSGVEHDIVATGPADCTVYYLYLPPRRTSS